MKADVSLSLVCGVAASSGGITWAHVLALAKLLTIQPIETDGAFWKHKESRGMMRLFAAKLKNFFLCFVTSCKITRVKSAKF